MFGESANYKVIYTENFWLFPKLFPVHENVFLKSFGKNHAKQCQWKKGNETSFSASKTVRDDVDLRFYFSFGNFWTRILQKMFRNSG